MNWTTDMDRPQVFASLIQGSYGGDHKNFEAVVRLASSAAPATPGAPTPGELWHYYRDNTDPEHMAWKPGAQICTNAAYAGSLIQSASGDAHVAGNFEVVVPVLQNNGLVQLAHYWRDNTTSIGPWALGAYITSADDHVMGPGCIIESSFGGGNFEVIVPLMGGDGNPYLQHFYRVHPKDPTEPWQRGNPVTPAGAVVTGPGCLIQNSWGTHDIHVVVPIKGPAGNPQLRHISRQGDDHPWVLDPIVITGPDDAVAGGGVLIGSDFSDVAGEANYEVLVGLRMPPGHIEIRHLYQLASDRSTWKRGQRLIASGGDSPNNFAAAGLALIQSDYPAKGPHGDFEALVAQCQQSIGCYAKFNGVTPPLWAGGWVPQLQDFTGRLPEEPYTLFNNPITKVCQLIGEFDLEGWTSVAIPNSHASTGTVTAVQEWSESDGSARSAAIFAWANGADHPIQLASSLDADAFTMQSTGDFSDATTALAAFNGQPYLAWKGAGNLLLNVAALNFHNDNGWSAPPVASRIGVDGQTDTGPALAAHGNQLVIAWRGVDENNLLNVAFWQPGSPTFGGKVTLNEVTIAQPALVSHNNQLFVAWAGGDRRVNVAVLPDGGAAVTAKITLPDTTQVGPALTSFRGALLLALTDDATGRSLIVSSSDNGQHFDGRPRTPQTSALASVHPETRGLPLAGGLASSPDQVYWAWTQGPVQQPSVARFIPPWNWNPARPIGTAFNRTESTAKIQGTDLGNQFMVDDRMCILFGDTAFSDPNAIFNLDTIAFADVASFDPKAGLPLTFNAQPPVIAGKRDSQKAFSVPLDGITVDKAMYLFYSLDSISLQGPKYMTFGHTDVVKSIDGGFNFTDLYTFSAENFLNVSINTVQGANLGLPQLGDTLAIWGTGIYHSSEPYLAAMPLSAIETGSPKYYYAGVQNGAPVWVQGNEDAAAPLFQDPTIAELSVRYNTYLHAWMMTYTSLSVHGVCVRLSATPWGPWTSPLRLQHIVVNAPAYVHVANAPDRPRQDWMYDGTAQVPGGGQEKMSTTGWIAYSPAVIAPLTRGTENVSTTIYYTMSTWSPYTVVLLTADLAVTDLAAIGWIPNAPKALTAAQTLDALVAVNIVTSIGNPTLLGYLNNPYSGYPAIAQALLSLLAGRRLLKYIYIDVIVGFYTGKKYLHLPLPETLADVQVDALQTAVLDAYNENWGASLTQFAQLFG
jgi:hypothetical protein